MAEVVGDGGVDAVPRELFKFPWWQTQQWADGKERILEPSVDYPSWMTFEELKKRLLRSTGRAKGTLIIWQGYQGKVHIIMTRYQHGRNAVRGD